MPSYNAYYSLQVLSRHFYSARNVYILNEIVLLLLSFYKNFQRAKEK